MHCFKGLRTASAPRLEREQEGYYIKNGSEVLEEFLALCDGNCRIPIRYFTARDIDRAIIHSQEKTDIGHSYMITGSLDNRLVLLRYFTHFSGEYQEISRDIAITAQMSHLKNVLTLVGCCLEFKPPVMVYEYIEPVTLHRLLFGNIHEKSLHWGNRLGIASQIASAIVFLHSEFKTPIIHRDLKPSKVMIDKNSGVAKLFDFSWSISLPPGELQVEEDRLCGTVGYADPEYLQSGIISQKVDVYSFGVVLLVLLTGRNVHDKMRGDSSISENEIRQQGEPRDCEEELPRDYEEEVPKEIRDDEWILNNSNYVMDIEQVYSANIEEWNVMDIVDPAILEEHGTGIQQQLQDYFELVNKCRSSKGEDRPYMIDVARELRRIHNCFRALLPAKK